MKEALIFGGLAIVSYILQKLFMRIHTDDPYVNSPEAEGIITKITRSDGGNLRYYVSFQTNQGNLVEGQSIYYTKTKGKYHQGDKVYVKYNVLSETRVRVKLIDDDIVPCGQSASNVQKILFIVSLLFGAVAIILAIMSFV